MPEFNLLQDFPRVKRRALGREVTKEAITKAEKLDFDYYDGDRKFGFGGYVYDGRWNSVAKLAKERYNLNENSVVLVDRSDKGFLIFDLKKIIPGITVYGIHPSRYVINHAMEGYGKWALINGIETGDPKIIEEKARQEINFCFIQGEGWNLPFKDKFFDSVVSINNVCSYTEEKARLAVREIIRVSKNNGENCYIQNDSWRTPEEERMLKEWSLLCRTYLDTKGWEKLYQEEGYNGDWGYTIIE